MKSLFGFLISLTLPVMAQEDRAPSRPTDPASVVAKPGLEPHDQVTQRSLARLEEKLGVKFNQPFPAQFDIDVYRRQPIALLPATGGKIAVTRPVINPYDRTGSIEWMTGPEKIAELGKISLDAFVHMDEGGEFLQISLVASPDGWTAEDGTPLIWRHDGETGREFTDRALLTYRLRAKKAADQAQALLLFSGFEKTLLAIHQCRKDEVFKTP